MDDAAALKRCIALGMGISILSRATVQTDAQQGRLLLFPPRTVSVPAPAVHCVSVHTTYVRAGYSLSGFYKKVLSDRVTAVLSGLTQPIEQEALLHRKPASRTTVRVPTGTRRFYPQGQNRQSVFLKFAGYGLDNRDNLREHYTDRTCYARTF